jgi:UDPglucose 6-dehydrogenase
MVGFIGLSHLGIVYSLATAAQGLEVLGFDPNTALCDGLADGRFPITEPGLPELFQAHRARLRFSSDPAKLAQCDLVFFSLDVPTDQANRSDLGPLRKLIADVGAHLAPTATVVVLCQVPPGFTRSLKAGQGVSGNVDSRSRRGEEADRGSENSPNPPPHLGGYPFQSGAQLFYQVETLIFGNAVERALKPERYIVGCEDPAQPLPKAYQQWLGAFHCPILPMRYESAELAKLAINLFLVSSVSTTNLLAEVCEQIGAVWSEIVPTLRLDKRIGPHAYLAPGLGIAGGNLERDLVSIQSLADQFGTEAGLVSAWQKNSRHRRDWVLRQLHELVLAAHPDPTIAIWGLAYKPNTRSVKNSPSLALIRDLGPFKKVAFDPEVKLDPAEFNNLQIAASALDAAHQAHALVIMTPWAAFANVPLAQLRERMASDVLLDPFGALPERDCLSQGFRYQRLGAPAGQA